MKFLKISILTCLAFLIWIARHFSLKAITFRLADTVAVDQVDYILDSTNYLVDGINIGFFLVIAILVFFIVRIVIRKKDENT